METYNTAHVDHAGLRMPSNAPLSRGRNLMPKRVAAFLALASLAVVITEAAAKPVVVGRLVSTKTAVERNCLIDGGHMTTEPSGQYSCVNSSTGLSTNCSSFGSCEIVCNGKECGGRARKPGAPARAEPQRSRPRVGPRPRLFAATPWAGPRPYVITAAR